MPEQQKGLYPKYVINKTNGEMVRGDYFVLRLDEGQKDQAHLEACRRAVNEYAKHIEGSNAQLAMDIRKRWPLLRPGDELEYRVQVTCAANPNPPSEQSNQVTRWEPFSSYAFGQGRCVVTWRCLVKVQS